jgi:YCII-related domain
VRYLFLLYGDPAGEAALPAGQRRAVVDAHVAPGRELAAAGALRAAEALGERVRVLRADGTVTDGPYAETKEQLGTRLPGGLRGRRGGARAGPADAAEPGTGRGDPRGRGGLRWSTCC